MEVPFPENVGIKKSEEKPMNPLKKTVKLFVRAIPFAQVPAVLAADPRAGIQVYPSDYVWNVHVHTMPVSPYRAVMIPTEGGLPQEKIGVLP